MSSRQFSFGVSLVILLGISIYGSAVHAIDVQSGGTDVAARLNNVNNGITLRNSIGTFFLNIPANATSALKHHFGVVLQAVSNPTDYSLNNETVLSDLYTYTIKNSQALRRSVRITLSYPPNQSGTNKVLKFWDAPNKRWKRLRVMSDNPGSLTMTGRLNLTTATIGVFQARLNDTNSATIQQGIASFWPGPGAGTNAFPKGSKLQVTNLDNHKQTEVTVAGSWSGDVKYGWLIDLPKEAFMAISDNGTTSAGLLRHIQLRLESQN